MGQDIHKTQFSTEEHSAFRSILHKNLKTFKALLSEQNFGQGKPSFGAELELYIIGQDGKPKPINTQIHDALNDAKLTLELNRFNLEYNLAPVTDIAKGFSNLAHQMDGALNKINQTAHSFDAQVLPIGILPTLALNDMGSEIITDLPRYHALAKALRDKRGQDFHIHIEGEETLDLQWGDVSPEGANTSFQFHYRVDPQNFCAAYNAAQLVTPVALALAANSPYFLGKSLWQETRVALFKQSIDTRLDDELVKQLPSRVLYGLGWLRKDCYELFAQSVYLFEPLLPICSEKDSNSYRPGSAPSLDELRLHLGSIWAWNRPVYDPSDSGHLRIELRSLPAGPSIQNMLATAAFSVGLMKGLESNIDELLVGLPFRYAEQNFYRAAKHGLKARLFWPSLRSGTLEERPVLDIAKGLIPVSAQGLSQIGLDDSEINKYLGTINDGIEAKVNGAFWQKDIVNKFVLKGLSKHEALQEMVSMYAETMRSGLPVHEWTRSV